MLGRMSLCAAAPSLPVPGQRMGADSTRAALVHQHRTSDRDRAVADRLGAIRAGGCSTLPQGAFI